VTLNGDARIIIGVLPREFHFGSSVAEFWTPFYPGGGCHDRRNCHGTRVVARLNDGVSIETALANVKVIAQQLEQQYPDSNRGFGAALTTLTETMVGDIRPILLVLLGGAGLLLLIASVNVASLLLVRSESRRREVAVRTALGASRGRIVCQFVTEGMVLVAAGTAVGLMIASWGVRWLSSLIPASQIIWRPYLQGLGLNIRIFVFAAAIALAAAALFSLTPTLHFFLSRKGGGIAEGARGSSGITWRRLGSKLVVVELATAVVLLVSAGLLGKSLYALLKVELGLRPACGDDQNGGAQIVRGVERQSHRAGGAGGETDSKSAGSKIGCAHQLFARHVLERRRVGGSGGKTGATGAQQRGPANGEFRIFHDVGREAGARALLYGGGG
jgi:macrolide transport system ATP-binding/permease protein